MQVTLRHFYCQLSSEKKHSLAKKLGISYTSLSNGWFNENPKKRIKPHHEQIELLLEAMDNQFTYKQVLDFYFKERKAA